jgi:hypothetical protein
MPTSRPSARWWPWPRAARLAGAHAGRRAGRHRAAAALAGRAFISAVARGWTPPLAARLPFALLLALTLALVWYTTFHLARTEAAQPVPFAFGGEADPVDYARAMADGAVLALMATLGLLQLGHETTPELAQLFAVSLLPYALAARPFTTWQPRVARAGALAAAGRQRRAQPWRWPWAWAATDGLPPLGLRSGARARGPGCWPHACWRAVAAGRLWGLALARTCAVGQLPDCWPSRASGCGSCGRPGRWRCGRCGAGAALLRRHLSVPLVAVLVSGLLANLAMAGSDRALMLACPAWRCWPPSRCRRCKRSAAAAIDWFSMFFFSARRLTIWVIYALDADRRAGQAGRQHRSPGARLRAAASRRSLAAGRGRARWPGCGWCAGAPAATARRCGRAWCCLPAAWRCAGCWR